MLDAISRVVGDGTDVTVSCAEGDVGYVYEGMLDFEEGTIELELNVIDAPITSDNFMTLARRGFYDGLTFHRVVPNYVIQGGDPQIGRAHV